ncbi:tyrosine--tRNA ligase [Patescibacteria group bacterium]|nr:tyrosine--tRNA ligase [Patescibacteria group bacterium]
MNKLKTKDQKIEDVLTRGVEKVIKKDSLVEKLNSGKKLRVKHGIDPTTKDLHLGYSTVYLKLKELQEMGHQIIFLIGDFTGRFGDPTEKIEARKLRDAKEVRNLAKNYLKQVGKILDLKKTEIRYNSEWYGKMKADELLLLMSNFTTARMLERDMFQERIKKGIETGLHEPVYPVLQAYDSVMLKSDLTVCGTDQLFNELKARELQQKFDQPGQEIIATKLLIGTDGKQKMSQSLGNYIGFEDSPNEQFGKIMSIPDNLIFEYFELITRVPLIEIGKLRKLKTNPKNLKSRLAKEIIKIYHGEKEAEKAEKEFNKVFRNKELPSDIPEIKIENQELNILDLLLKTKLVASKAEARRLVEQGAVKIDSKIIKDWQTKIETRPGRVLQIGKRRFAKIK